jgi:hypothetical protein
MEGFAEIWARSRVLWQSTIFGAMLGFVFYVIADTGILSPAFNANTGDHGLTLTVAFLFVVPCAMGYLTVRSYLRSAPVEKIRWYKWLFLPWASVIALVVVCVLPGWEGWPCLIMASPIMLFFATCGGAVARLLWGSKYKNQSPGTLSAYALPLLLILIEPHIPAPDQLRIVNTEIMIHAPASTVWANIKSVRSISPSELKDSWVSQIGFPKPVAATLSHDGIGGVRQASFTGGLVFTETVNQWEPENDLRFSIHANTESIPKSTLDEHVTIGGEYFDVLDGEYRLEQRPDGVLLHLTSRERLSTHFNFYAGVWTDAVMRAIQNQILVVIRNRCESGS